MASPGKTVCDVRSVELTWNACEPNGVLVRGACAAVTAATSDYLDAPRIGFVYFQCPQGAAAMPGGCAGYAASLAGANDSSHCVDFVSGTLRSEILPLPAPESPDYPPLTWSGCDKLKSYTPDAGMLDLGGIDFRRVPAGCDAGPFVEGEIEAGPGLDAGAVEADGGGHPGRDGSASTGAQLAPRVGAGGCALGGGLPADGHAGLGLLLGALSLGRRRRGRRG